MNYLAHLHIADATKTSVTGNLLGDFVKGRVDDLPFNSETKKGIRLHRAVDSFTDHHPEIRTLKATMGPYRRYAGIILDVLFDHHLAVNFSSFHSISLADFASHVYANLEVEPEQHPTRFVVVCQRMQKMNWLAGYNDLENIERALNGISLRLKKPVDLTEALVWHQDNYQQFDAAFHRFYLELLSFASKEVKEKLI